VLALELPHVSQRWVLWVPTVDEVAEVVVSILDRNALSSCCLVGHSYGTAVASRLLQQAPRRIQQLCLIDPICFTMFMPNLLRNFLYESPRSGSLLGDFMMMSAARDLHVSATLSRRFFWSGAETRPGCLWLLCNTVCIFVLR
jgi:pimeloyl-ACP methyl ester carboxylesterase